MEEKNDDGDEDAEVEDSDDDKEDDDEEEDGETIFNPRWASDTCNHGGQVAPRPPTYNQIHPQELKIQFYTSKYAHIQPNTPI